MGKKSKKGQSRAGRAKRPAAGSGRSKQSVWQSKFRRAGDNVIHSEPATKIQVASSSPMPVLPISVERVSTSEITDVHRHLTNTAVTPTREWDEEKKQAKLVEAVLAASVAKTDENEVKIEAESKPQVNQSTMGFAAVPEVWLASEPGKETQVDNCSSKPDNRGQPELLSLNHATSKPPDSSNEVVSLATEADSFDAEQDNVMVEKVLALDHPSSAEAGESQNKCDCAGCTTM